MFRTNNYIQKIQSLSKLTRSEFVQNQIRLCNQAQQVLEKKRSLDFETYHFMKLTYENPIVLKDYETTYIQELFNKTVINDDDFCFICLNNLEQDAYFKTEVMNYLEVVNKKLKFLERCQAEKMYLEYHKE
jgi:hypothetical protein